MALFGLYTSKKEKRAMELEVQRKNEELDKTQLDLGEELRRHLQNAASQNDVVNKFRDGRVCDTVGNIRISPIPKNGQSYSLLIRVENSGIAEPKFYDIMQVDINLRKPGQELHTFRCSYGPDNYSHLSSFNEKKQELSDFVRDYRLLK